MFMGILLAIVVPILGFMVARMKDINTGATPPVKDCLHVAGGALVALGAITFAGWALIWFFSLATGGSSSTIIDLGKLFYYALVTLAVGGTVMGLTRPQ